MTAMITTCKTCYKRRFCMEFTRWYPCTEYVGQSNNRKSYTQKEEKDGQHK